MSTEGFLPSYEAVNDALKSLDALGGAAETHGLLCAFLCGGAAMTKQAWVESLQSSFHDPKDPEFKKISELLVNLYDATELSLKSEQLDIKLLLPEDTQPVHEQIQALAEWCQGFLSGLKLLGLKKSAAYSPEIQETLDDLIRISCLEYEPSDDADAEAEASFVELEEFVRMAVVLLVGMKQDLLPKRSVKMSGNQTVH